MKKMSIREMRHTNGGLLLSALAIGIVAAAYSGAMGVAYALSKSSRK